MPKFTVLESKGSPGSLVPGPVLSPTILSCLATTMEGCRVQGELGPLRLGKPCAALQDEWDSARRKVERDVHKDCQEKGPEA